MSQRLFLHFLQSKKRITISRNITVGRSRSRCDIVLPQHLTGRTETISATHFKITRWESGQYVIIDLDSSNGTWLNGEKLVPYEHYPLFNRDVIQVTGNKQFKMQIVIQNIAAEEDDSLTRDSSVATVIHSKVIHQPGIHFDEKSQTFIIDNQTIPDRHLNDQEWDLLRLLCDKKDTVCTYDEIEQVVWGIPVAKNTLTQKVNSLRKKLDAIVPQSGKSYIQSVYGYGYKYASGRR